MGQPFGQQLPHFAGTVNAHEKNAQGMGELVRVEVIQPAPEQAEAERKHKKQNNGFTVKTPVLEGVGGRCR